MKIYIDPQRCEGSGNCIKACPQQAISFNQQGKAQVDHQRCDLDGICIPACPFEAISFVEEA